MLQKKVPLKREKIAISDVRYGKSVGEIVLRYSVAAGFFVTDGRMTPWRWVSKCAGAEAGQGLRTIKWSGSVLYRDKSSTDRLGNDKGR